jgi:Fe(3+) dicitrate transport protein
MNPRFSLLLLTCLTVFPLCAQESRAQTKEATVESASGTVGTQTLDTIVVTAETESKPVVQGPFLPDVLDGKIFAGKKTSVIDFDSLPQIQTDNYRQAFSKTPGLLVSELSNNSLLSLGSRGIGDPHESQDIMVLKDGIPFVMDMFGYPTVYYAPPLESMDRMEFVRGGSALLYGPQPGGSLNYISHRPSLDKPFEFSTQNLVGSNNFYSNYTSMDGTIGRVSYLINYNHRSGDSFRDHNSDYELNGGTIMLGLDLDKSTRWLLDIDIYKSNSGEPGGLNLLKGGSNLNYNESRTQAQLRHDRLLVERYFGSLTLEHDFSPATQMTWKVFGGYSNRTSRRQRGAGFGTPPPSPNTGFNTINEHRYYTIGTDVRFSHQWMAWGQEHQLTAGMTSTYTYAPIQNSRGATPSATDGVLYNDITRRSSYISFFAENQFKFGRFSVIPAVRVENVWQTITDEVRLNSNNLTQLQLRDRADAQHVPLGALGLSFDVTQKSALYFNLSQGYKPPTYADALPINNNVANTDLQPGHTLTYELGYRGNPSPYYNWDISGFFIDYQDRFGSTSTPGPGAVTTVRNVGQSRNWGIDFAGEVDLIALAAGKQAESATKRFGNLAFHVAYEWLNASFVDGPVDGLEPQYAPEHLLRFGLTYRWRDRFKVSLLRTYVSQHYANDNNSPEFSIPSYSVTDLIAEAKVYKDNVTVLAGINNLFDQGYYSRIRGNGIDPAYGRNFYVGVRFNY